MSLTLAAALANVLNFVIFTMIAVWYVAPWLATRERAQALVPLLWVQAFRHIAFQIFSSQHFGFAVSNSTRDQIAAGDVMGMLLAVAAIISLRYRWPRPALDLGPGCANGVRPGLHRDPRRPRAALCNSGQPHMVHRLFLCPATVD